MTRCGCVCGWLLQTASWCAILYMIVAASLGNVYMLIGGAGPTALIIFGYWTLSFARCCDISFDKTVSIEELYLCFEEAFKAPPELQMILDCYHTEMVTITTTDEKGETEVRTESQEVTTHYVRKNYTYTSWRDISGPLVLDIMKLIDQKPVDFVNVYISQTVKLAEDGTREDFSVPGSRGSQVIQVGKTRPTGYNICWYVLLTLVFGVEFYRRLFNIVTTSQNFHLTKLVSAKVDLNTEEFGAQYQHLPPSFTYMGQRQVDDLPLSSPYNSQNTPTLQQKGQGEHTLNAHLLRHYTPKH